MSTHGSSGKADKRPSALERRTAFALGAPLLLLLYTFFTIAYAIGVDTPDGSPLPRWVALMTGATTGFFAWLTVSVHTRRYEQPEEDLWAGVASYVLLANISVIYVVHPADWTAYNYVFLMIGLGVVVSSRGWFAALMGSALLSLILLSLVATKLENTNSTAVVTATLTGGMVSCFLFVVRRAAVLRVHALTIEANRKRMIAEDALSVAKRARADLQQIVESAPDAVIVLIGGRIEYANQNFLSCLRLRETEVIGAPLDEFTYSGSLDETGTSRLYFRRSDGETVILEFSEPAHIEQEGAEAQLYIGRDVSAADSDLQAKLQLSDRMAAIGVLASGVAHEINNPLAYVLGNLSTLESESDRFAGTMSPEDSEDFVDLIADALHGARRVATIVQDLSAIARTEDALTEANVQAAIDSSIRIAQPHLTHNAKLELDLDEVPTAACNQARLSQIILNLIINAAHALKDASGEHTIAIRSRFDPIRESIFIEVEDTGSGMDAETQRRLFEPFYTTKPVGQGTGLGLYFCMNEVERVGGELSFTSEVGVGTCFTIRLPLYAAPGQERPKPKRSYSTTGLRILIIDDDAMVCKTLTRLLRGNETKVCAEASQALQLITEEDFDVIFCDMMMPIMTGDVLYSEAQKRRPGIGDSFIFITGGAFTAETEAFLASVPGQVVLKPFARNNLQAALHELSLRVGTNEPTRRASASKSA